MQSIQDQVRAIAAEVLLVEVEAVTPDARFVDDLGADSLKVAELVFALEETFGLTVPDDAFLEISTVSDASRYVERRLAALKRVVG